MIDFLKYFFWLKKAIWALLKHALDRIMNECIREKVRVASIIGIYVEQTYRGLNKENESNKR